MKNILFKISKDRLKIDPAEEIKYNFTFLYNKELTYKCVNVANAFKIYALMNLMVFVSSQLTLDKNI